jgi:hypothetical protein
MQEFCVKNKDRIEVVTMIGVYGFLVTAIEVYPSYNVFCYLAITKYYSNLVFQLENLILV